MSATIIVFSDPGKDGDDLMAIYFLLLAKKAGLIPADQPIKIITADEIPCDPIGRQHPEGEFGLRALYLRMALKQSNLEGLCEVVAGPRTSYYAWDPKKSMFYDALAGSEAFYPSVEKFAAFPLQAEEVSAMCLHEDWSKRIVIGTEFCHVVSMASLDGVGRFLSEVPPERIRSYVDMGYNAPYAKSEADQKKISGPEKELPYNLRSSEPASVARYTQAILRIENALHVVSGTTRLLQKYTKDSASMDPTDIMARAFLLLAGKMDAGIQENILDFIKASKYKAFWPHDVVAIFALLLGIVPAAQWEKLGLPPLNQSMLFMGMQGVSGDAVGVAPIGNTVVLFNRKDYPSSESVGGADQHFRYGTAVDGLFFTALMHCLSLASVEDATGQYEALFKAYRNILMLRANKVPEKAIQAEWIYVLLLELYAQLSMTAPNEAEQYILGSVSKPELSTLFKLGPAHRETLRTLVADLLTYGAAHKEALDERLLPFLARGAEGLLTGQLVINPRVREILAEGALGLDGVYAGAFITPAAAEAALSAPKPAFRM